jgi:hypothetical protein
MFSCSENRVYFVTENITEGRASANIFNVGKMAHQVSRQGEKKSIKTLFFGERQMIWEYY